MMAHSLRRWPNIIPASLQRLECAGIQHYIIKRIKLESNSDTFMSSIIHHFHNKNDAPFVLNHYIL